MVEKSDTGLACLLLLASLHEVAADAAQLQHQFGRELMDVPTLLLAAQSLQLTAKAVRQDVMRLDKAALPAIASLQDGRLSRGQRSTARSRVGATPGRATGADVHRRARGGVDRRADFHHQQSQLRRGDGKV